MAKTCRIAQDSVETVIASDKAVDRAIDDTKFLANPDYDLAEIILTKMGKKPGDIITDDEMNDVFRQIFNERYGKDPETGETVDVVDLLGGQASAESIILAGKITAMLQAYPELYDVFRPYILKRIPEGVTVDKGRGVPILHVLPVPTLKNIYAQIFGMVNNYAPVGRSDKKFFHGTFKGFIVRYKTPGQMLYRDPSGGLSVVQKSGRDYPDITASRISVFMNNPEMMPDEIKYELKAAELGKDVSDLSAKERRDAKKAWKKNPSRKKSNPEIYGMAHIYQMVEELVDDLNIKGDDKADKIQNIFHMLMRGEMSLQELENGNLVIYKDYKELRDENNKIIRHEKKGTEVDGVPVLAFQNPEPLKEHTPMNRKKGEFYLELTDGTGNTKNIFKELARLVKAARRIDNAVFYYAKKEMEGSVNALFNELNESMRLPEDDLYTLFFRTGTERHLNLVEWLRVNDPKNYKLYQIYNETFGTLVSQENVIANGGAYDLEAPTYRQDHFPTLYQKDDLRLMMENLADVLEVEVKALEDAGVQYKTLAQLYKGERNGTTTEEEWHLYNKSGQLTSAQAIVDNMDNYQVDLTHNTLIPLASDNKHFKRLSNAFDIRMGRRDNGVYFDYLKNTMSTIQRNYAVADLIKGLRLINDSKRLPEDEKESLINYSTNLFKVPFHSSTIKGFMGLSDESISKIIRIPGRLIKWVNTFTPSYVTSMFKYMASGTSALFLGGFMSPMTNLTGQFQNVNDYGRKMMKRASDTYKNHEDEINNLLTISGLLEFGDFFGQSMINGITGVQLSQDAHSFILEEQFKYHSRVMRGVSEEKAEKKFLDAVSFILSQSKSFLNPEDVKIISKQRAKARKKQLKLDSRLTAAQKLLQFSIERNWEYRKILRAPGFKGAVGWGKRTAGSGVFNFYTNIMKFLTSLPGEKSPWKSMSNAEKYIRTISFIIGVQRAHDSGLLNREENWWEYTDKLDIEKAIQIGKEYTYFTNFGMSTQAVGPYNYNGVGNLVGKFRYWSQQKAGRDIRIFRDAYRSLKSEEKIEGRGRDRWYKFKNFDVKAIVNLITKIANPKGWSFYTGVGKYQETLRKTHPEVAALRTFLTTQVFMTFLWDVLLGGPLRIASHVPYLGAPIKLMRQGLWATGMGGQVKNFTSELASIMMFPLTLLAKVGVNNMLDYEDDDEDIDRALTYYLRRIPFWGFLPSLGFDVILGTYYNFTSQNDHLVRDKVINSTKVVRGGLLPGWSWLSDKISKGIYDKLTDY